MHAAKGVVGLSECAIVCVEGKVGGGNEVENVKEEQVRRVEMLRQREQGKEPTPGRLKK